MKTTLEHIDIFESTIVITFPKAIASCVTTVLTSIAVTSYPKRNMKKKTSKKETEKGNPEIKPTAKKRVDYKGYKKRKTEILKTPGNLL